MPDLRSQEHEGGQVQQTLELGPGGLQAGGQQGEWWPVGEHHGQALAHQQLQVGRYLGHAEHPVLQAAHVTGTPLWGHRESDGVGKKVQNEHQNEPPPANGKYIGNKFALLARYTFTLSVCMGGFSTLESKIHNSKSYFLTVGGMVGPVVCEEN